MTVTIILEDCSAARALADRARTYFAEAGERLGLALTLDLGFDRDPARRARVDEWRRMVRQQRERHPDLPLAFPDAERSAALVGPMMLVGLDQIATSLDDDALRKARRLVLAQQGGAGGPAQPTVADPRLAERVHAALRSAQAPARPWFVRLALAVALGVGALFAALCWWVARWPASASFPRPEAPNGPAALGRKRRRRR